MLSQLERWYIESKKKIKARIEDKRREKESIRDEFKIGLKDLYFFFAGLLIGTLTGVIGNYWVNAYFRYIDKIVTLDYFRYTTFLFVSMIAIFIISLWYIQYRMKKEYFKRLKSEGIGDEIIP